MPAVHYKAKFTFSFYQKYWEYQFEDDDKDENEINGKADPVVT